MKTERAPSIFGAAAVPRPTPETLPYWEGARAGELRLPRCASCGHVFFPPRPVCPGCQARRIEWFRASGRGTLYSYVINRNPPPFWGTGPQSCAMVTLEEGPRVISCIVDCEQTPEALQLDMPLEVTFRPMSEEISLPVFRPATGGRS